MNRKRAIREFVLNAQEDHCLLCEHPLVLRGHLHHVIARDDGGPPHPLNLVGLCPNHHFALEVVRRHVAPSEQHRRSGWHELAQAAIEVADRLPEEHRRAFFQLSDPHPLRQPIMTGVEAQLHRALARDIARADVIMLLAANVARPRALLIWRMARQQGAPFAAADIEVGVEQVRETASSKDVAAVVEWHLRRLGLPYEERWLDGKA